MARRTPREIELQIDTLEEDGLGEGRFGERVVRARNALPGEQVALRVLKRRRGVWYGEADVPESPSPWRRTPPCPVFPRCGGCAMQHLDYGHQLELKQSLLMRELAARNVLPLRQRRPVHGPRLHYRFKARLGVRVVGGELLAGFREGFSNRVARMSDCKTLAAPLARLLAPLQQTLAQLSAPDRIPQVELAAGDRDCAVIVRHLTELDQRDHELLRGFADTQGVRVYLQPGGYDTVWRLDERGGGDLLAYSNPDYGLFYEFQPMDFTQVNPYMNRRLVRDALLALAPRAGATATDLFCGIGNFSLALARAGLQVRGHEAAAGAIDRARRNAALNGLSGRAEFAVTDLYDARCPALPESEYLLLDPPRSGAGPNLQHWADWSRLERVVYVSCNPRTFAEDAAVLASRGFTLEEAGIYDMFPHTAHVETLGTFVRRPSGGSPRG